MPPHGHHTRVLIQLRCARCSATGRLHALFSRVEIECPVCSGSGLLSRFVALDAFAKLLEPFLNTENQGK
jgi:hypothetical protein